jgi:hypothetical protein
VVGGWTGPTAHHCIQVVVAQVKGRQRGVGRERSAERRRAVAAEPALRQAARRAVELLKNLGTQQQERGTGGGNNRALPKTAVRHGWAPARAHRHRLCACAEVGVLQSALPW